SARKDRVGRVPPAARRRLEADVDHAAMVLLQGRDVLHPEQHGHIPRALGGILRCFSRGERAEAGCRFGHGAGFAPERNHAKKFEWRGMRPGILMRTYAQRLLKLLPRGPLVVRQDVPRRPTRGGCRRLRGWLLAKPPKPRHHEAFIRSPKKRPVMPLTHATASSRMAVAP